MFYKKGILKKFLYKSQENACARFSFLIKFQACSDSYFTVNFAKLLRTLFFNEHLQWLLLSDVAKLKEKKNRTHIICK